MRMRIAQTTVNFIFSFRCFIENDNFKDFFASYYNFFANFQDFYCFFVILCACYK